jgi:hypothetical protein
MSLDEASVALVNVAPEDQYILVEPGELNQKNFANQLLFKCFLSEGKGGECKRTECRGTGCHVWVLAG